MAIDFMAMKRHIETEPANNLSLDVFQLAAVEFHDLAATKANEMIVMSDVHVVLGISVGKLAFHCHAGLNQKLQSPIDGGGIDPLPFAAEALV